MIVVALCFGLAAGPAPSAQAQNDGNDEAAGPPKDQPNPQVNGIFPKMTVMGKGAQIRSEAAIGALMPWADKLWAVAYVSHGDRGVDRGVGLYEISDDMTMRKHPASVTGTYANRMVHWASDQAILGPHFIDAEGNVRTVEDLAVYRLAGTMQHLTDPENKVYFLTMAGLLFEVDVHTLEVRELMDVEQALGDERTGHFKQGFTANGRVVVADNFYDHTGEQGGEKGILAEWDGESWSVIDVNPYVEINGLPDYGGPIFATGFDRASVILQVFHDEEWKAYRLPKASHTYDHNANTEWYRIRQVQSERFLMDAHGMFYELPAFVYGGHLWGIRPIATHLRIIPDFVSWRGMLVLGSDMQEHDGYKEGYDMEPGIGQPQSGFWFGKTDDLWSWGKPSGWGGPWWKTAIEAGAVSEPYLMNGFDEKVLHLTQEGEESVTFTVEVDFLGDGTWKTYERFSVSSGGYVHHEFPDGFSAQWVRITADKSCVATAYFMYN